MNPSDAYSKSHEQTVQAMHNDARPSEELVREALSAGAGNTSSALAALWYRPPSEVLRVGESLVNSQIPSERMLGVRVLGQGGIPERISSDASLAVLLPLLEREQDTSVLGAIAAALGDIADTRAIEPIIGLKHHPSEDVRFGVVQGLLHYRDLKAVDALIDLTKDQSREVRDWAAFALAQQEEFDTPDVRDALWALAADEDDDIRGEALVGLARRGDTKVIESLLRELESAGSEAGQILFEAVIEAGKRLSDSRICGALSYLKSLDDHFGLYEELEEALARCKT